MKTLLAVCLLAGAVSAQTAQTPQTPQTAAAPQAVPAGSIEGQVFNLATGAPLKRATVRLTMTRSGGGGRGPGGPGGPQQQSRETDDTGRFSFTNLDTGRYMLSAERQGYLRANYGGRKFNTSGTPIILGKDQRLTEMVLKLNPQSVIVGKVLDEDGEPVANVNVRAYKMGYRSGKKQWVNAGGGTTSDIGEYRIPQLDPGRYLVATNQMRMRVPPGAPSNAPLPDAPDMRYAATYYPSTTQEASAAPVDVQAGGETRGIDIRLVKSPVYRVRGRVQVQSEARNFPMVMLVPRDGSRGPQGESMARPPDYRFEVAGVAPGSYILYAMNGGRGGAQDQSLAFQPIEVGNRHVDNILLSPTPGGEVHGAVKVDGDQNSAVDVTKLNIVLRPTVDMGRPARGKPAATGAFVLSGVVPMKYSVNVNGIPDGCYVKSIYYGGREVNGDDGFDIVGGGTIDVVLGADAGSVSAAVVDKDGKAVSTASVALVVNGATVETRTSDENGAVSFNGLKPGDYTVIAWEDMPPGAYWDPDYIKKYSGTTVKIEPRGKPAVQVKAVPAE